MSRRRAPIAPILMCVVLQAIAACSSRSYTPPHSEIVAAAKDNGVAVQDATAEREAFFAAERNHAKRLAELMDGRAGSGLANPGYRLGAGDQVEINVFDVPELNLTVRIRESGFVSLPLIGAVKASGRSEAELSSELANRLASYIKRPQVSVFINNYGSQKVAVMGAVRRPGAYSLRKGDNTLLELISQAGGMTEKAGNFLDIIPGQARDDAEAEQKAALSLDSTGALRDSAVEIPIGSILGTNGAIPLDVPVRAGDMIVIPEAGKVVVEGEVARTGNYIVSPQMSLLGALASAGGITYGAKIDEVEVVREIGRGAKARLVLDLSKIASGEEKDVPLKSGDLIRVPTHMGRRLTHDTFEGITKLINFGVGGNVNLAN